MKGAWWSVVGLVAAILGWIWWSRRQQGKSLLPVAGETWGDTLQSYVASAATTRPGGLPPVAPSSAPGWRDQVGVAAGVAGASTAAAVCVAYGGGPLCAAAAPIGKVAGQLQAQVLIKAGEYTVAGAKAVGSGVATGAKAVALAPVKLFRAIF